MRAKIVLLVALAGLALILAVWLALGRGTGTVSTPEIVPSTPNSTSQSAAHSPEVKTEALENDAQRQERRSDDRGAQRSESFALDDANWIEGRVEFPSGTPSDEKLRVWAVSEPMIGDVHGTFETQNGWMDSWAMRDVAEDHSFRVPYPKSQEKLYLGVEGRWLYVDEWQACETKLISTPVIVRPKLGAIVLVRVRLPESATRDDAPVGASVTLSCAPTTPADPGKSPQPIGIQRGLRLSGDLTAEFLALPPSRGGYVQLIPPRLCSLDSDLPELRAGQRLELPVALERGLRVSGKITQRDGTPLEKVRVWITRKGEGWISNWGQSWSASDGSYTLFGLPPGRHRVNCELEGHLDRESEEFTLEEGVDRTGFDIVLEEGNHLAGRAVWPDGTPAGGVKLEAHSTPRKPNEKKRELSSADGMSAADGTFRLGGLKDGPFFVTARKESEEDEPSAVGAATSAGRKVADGKDAVREGTAELSDLAANTDGLVLTLREALVARGRVLDDLGQPVSSFTLRFSPTGKAWYGTNAQRLQDFESNAGRFEMPGLFEGTWSLVVSADAYVSDEKALAITLPLATDLELHMHRAASVSGTVLDSDGQAAPGANVQQVEREDSGGPFGRKRKSGGPTTGADGAFTLGGLGSGNLHLRATRDGACASETLELQLAPGQKLEGVVLRLRNGAAVAGEIFANAGEVYAGQQVQMFNAKLGENTSAPIDAANRFHAEHLVPGVWQIMLEPDKETLAPSGDAKQRPSQAEMLSKMKMTSATLREGETTRVVLGAPPKSPVRVHGRVTRAKEPAAGYGLMVLREGTAIMQGMKVTSVRDDGSYEITLDDSGLMVFLLSKKVGSDPGLEFPVRVPEAKDFELDLHVPLGGVRGHVLDPEGKPLAGQYVSLTPESGAMGLLAARKPGARPTDASGSFEYLELNAGRYALDVGGMDFAARGEAAFGRVHARVDVHSDEILEGVVLQLVEAGSIRGSVLGPGGDPVSGVSIFARTSSGDPVSRYPTCVSDPAGHFVYSGLAPGSYTLSARGPKLAARDGNAIAVQAKGASEATITLESAAELDVQAVDKDERPCSVQFRVLDERGVDAAEIVQPSDLAQAMDAGISTSSRHFGVLPPGDWIVEARASDGRKKKESIKLKPAEVRELTLKIE